jgi:hypothetical protein
MGEKGKTLFMSVAVDLKKMALLWPDTGLRGSVQYELTVAGIPDIRMLKFTHRTPNKNANPPCGRFFTPVLRFTAPASAILAPARKQQINN